MMKLDTTIIEALSLDPNTTTVKTHGSSGFNATAKISTTLNDGTQKHLFMKTAHGQKAEVMFRGELASLNAIHAIVPSLCPAALYTGVSKEDGTAFLVTDFLDLSSSSSSSSGSSGGSSEEQQQQQQQQQHSGMSLAAKLAKLHTTPAPTPQGYTHPVFGFPETTCCGDTPQPNGYETSWANFYARNRLQAILEKCERNNGKDAEVRAMVEKVVEKVVPRLIGDEHLNGGKGVMPVVVHGDLWSGNKGRGRIGGKGAAVEDVVFDPSAVYGHSEYELGIMNMFGGFDGKGFWEEYHRICPMAEPVAEYGDRVRLYELYHHLNHFTIFGSSYRSGAVAIMKDLVRKYGD
ncbi:MAG: hypothetical protein LQ350_004456 [Teloschistes chrysophthalmus]|nr:MAG: hypothetical protein LQ350_004456 [Niorma chrysophthalma]